MDDTSQLKIAELGPSAGTTPDAIEIQRRVDLDYLEVRSQIIDDEGRVPSRCAIASAHRSGPDAVDWPLGSWLRLPLDHGVVLPDGVYAELVLIGFLGEAGDTRWQLENDMRFFEVADGRFRARTYDEHAARVLPPPGPDGARAGVGDPIVRPSAEPQSPPPNAGCPAF